jgi:hypothetical protein
MNRKTLYVLALIFFVMLWAVFSWPLGKHLFTGIPSSGTNLEKGNVIRMVPGDHLQLLYNFWLAKDMMSGDTPLFYNLYEFNTGSDEARLIPRPLRTRVNLVCAHLPYRWRCLRMEHERDAVRLDWFLGMLASGAALCV